MNRPSRFFGAAAVALALAGCASGFRLDNEVTAFSQLTAAPAQPTYRFERSLSQQADARQGEVEAMAEPALAKAGLRRDDAAAAYTVQLSVRAERVLSPHADPWSPWGWSGAWGAGWGGPRFGLAFGGPGPRTDAFWFRREVGVILRETAANRTVYETQAISEGPWGDDRAVLPAMFEAALQGFPTPPPGPRRVDIHVGGPQP